MPRENYDRGLPAALIFCDSRAMLEDRIMALREANKYNIHTDRHLIGLPRIIAGERRARGRGAVRGLPDRPGRRDPAVRDRPLPRPARNRRRGGLKIRDKLVLLDTFAVPTLLATPL